MHRKIFFILLLTCFSQLIFAQSDLVNPKAQDEIEEIEQDTIDDAAQNESNDEEAIVDYNEEYDEADEYEERPEWDLREVDKKKWTKLKKDKRFIYKKEEPQKEKVSKPKKNYDLAKFFNSALFKFILYTLFGLFLIYIIYLFVKNNDISFRKNIKDAAIVIEEPWEDVRSFDEWELALQRALRDKDYRLATRIYYLHTLSILNSHALIKFQEDKTNWYYVQKLFGTSYHDDFMELTKSFDYIWYGEYEISESQFGQLQSQFKGFHYKLG